MYATLKTDLCNKWKMSFPANEKICIRQLLTYTYALYFNFSCKNDNNTPMNLKSLQYSFNK